MNRTQLERLVKAARRRLEDRQLQAAKMGINTDPMINIEVEDLTEFLRVARISLNSTTTEDLAPETIPALRETARAVNIVF